MVMGGAVETQTHSPESECEVGVLTLRTTMLLLITEAQSMTCKSADGNTMAGHWAYCILSVPRYFREVFETLARSFICDVFCLL